MRAPKSKVKTAPSSTASTSCLIAECEAKEQPKPKRDIVAGLLFIKRKFGALHEEALWLRVDLIESRKAATTAAHASVNHSSTPVDDANATAREIADATTTTTTTSTTSTTDATLHPDMTAEVTTNVAAADNSLVPSVGPMNAASVALCNSTTTNLIDLVAPAHLPTQ